MKEDKRGALERCDMHVQFYLGNLHRRDHLGDLDTDGRTISKQIMNRV
jgi:hypothetical protein